MRLFDRFFWASALAIAPGTLIAQSCNIDLDLVGASQEVGGGVPSSTFGAAAGSPGYWCDVSAGGPRNPVGLFGLDGAPIGAHIVAGGGIGSQGGFNSSWNTGDYKALLDDYADIGGVGPENDYFFTGMVPGRYLIYTYCANSSRVRTDTWVSVPGSLSSTQDVTGPMPGNAFVLGVTHSIHELVLTGSSFEIDIRGTWPNSEVNGFQLVAVPEEPSGTALLSLGALALLRKKRA